MRRMLAASVLPLVFATTAAAQAPAPPQDTGPMTTYLRRAFAAVSMNLLAAAEMMPAEDYAFRPTGVAGNVRTFAQLIGHTLEVNSFVCAATRAQTDPLAGVDGDTITDKARLVQMLKDSIAYCSAYLERLDDRAAATAVVTKGSDNISRSSVPFNALVFAIAHSNEHYGNVVTYLRARGLVPPATPAQAGWRMTVPSGIAR